MRHTLRKVLLGTLVLIMPLNGMGMICLGSPRTTPEASQQVGDCTKICARKRAPQGGAGCVLTGTDSSLAFFVFGIAVSPSETHVALLTVTRRLRFEPPELYLNPDLLLRTPPPKV
ncbi:MAG: hypothetical protein GEU99_07760 [Luteitalea sp.]|nr:hypothetical protein [Luteitalea sp.]